MKKIILIGGGGHCKSCIEVIESANEFDIAGIIDLKCKIGDKILGYSFIACDDDLLKLKDKYDYAFITVGKDLIFSENKIPNVLGYPIFNVIRLSEYRNTSVKLYLIIVFSSAEKIVIDP